jgi:hypothetical protein
MDQQQTTSAPVAKEDLSSRTVLILAVLVVVVSLIGAFINVRSAFSTTPMPEQHIQGANGVASVGFTVQGPKPPLVDKASGKVVLEITK